MVAGVAAAAVDAGAQVAAVAEAGGVDVVGVAAVVEVDVAQERHLLCISRIAARHHIKGPAVESLPHVFVQIPRGRASPM